MKSVVQTGFAPAFIVLAFALAPTASAQESEPARFRTSAVLHSPRSVTEVYSADCPDFESASCDYPGTATRTSCDVVSFDTLGTVRDRQVWLGRYLRSQTFESTDGVDEWTCESDEIVLLEAAGPGYVRPAWYGTSERTYEFITSARVFRSPRGDIFSATYCLNGTGGCEQRLLVSLSDGWRVVERDSTWEHVFGQLPPGYRPHKSPAMDLNSLKWEHHVAGPNDANCCPSGRLYLELDLIGHLLTIRKARLEIDLPLPGSDPR